MAKKIWSKEISLDILKGKTIAVIGYGNQGRSQALNLRDSGMNVIIGNTSDDYRAIAESDSQKIFSIKEAAKKADVLMILIPDEIQAKVIKKEILPNMKHGAALCFGHGYNVHFHTFDIPKKADIILVAPRMIGGPVRDCYLRGQGFCNYVAVAQNYTGKAEQIALALAKGMGGSSPAIMTTFEEETVIDLFGEQVGGGGALVGTLYQFETLVEAGFDPETIQLELYGSGELVEVARATYEEGLMDQFYGHSRTSQYGQMKRCNEFATNEMREEYRRVIKEIRNGTFAAEWAKEQESGYVHMEQMRAKFNQHPIIKAEKSNRDLKKRMDKVIISKPGQNKRESLEAVAKKSNGALLIGGGGGADVVQALPMKNFLQTLGMKKIIIANTAINWWEGIPGQIPWGGDVYSLDQLTETQPINDDVVQVSGKTVLRSGPGKSQHPKEAEIASLYNTPAFTIGLKAGTKGIVKGLKTLIEKYELDMIVAIDNGADSFYSGKEHTISSPLVDAMVMSAIIQVGVPAFYVLAGYGCDAEMTITQLTQNVGEVMRHGGFLGAHGLTPEDLELMDPIFKGSKEERLESWGYRAAQGNIGSSYTKEFYPIEVTPLTAIMLFFDPNIIVNHLNPLPNLVANTISLKQAEDILMKKGLVSETQRPLFIQSLRDK